MLIKCLETLMNMDVKIDKKVEIPSENKYIREISHEILSHLERLKVEEAVRFDIRLAVEEAVRNSIEHGPPEEQNQIRIMLAESLRAVVTQMLVPRIDGKGLAIACEILVGTVPLANLIRSEKTHQIPSLMQTGKSVGMQSMDEALMDLFQRR